MSTKEYNVEYLSRSHKNSSFDVPDIQITQSHKSTSEDDIPARGKWGKSVESLLLCISMSVGLGNVWRFPSVAYDNGGGAFLIPYLLLLFIIGRPLYYLELILGQFSSQGSIEVWRIVPAFKGIGYAQVMSVSFVVIFYNYLMALSLYYIFASMQSCLPWTECYYPDNFFQQNSTLNSTDNVTMTPSLYFWKHMVLEENLNARHELSSISWKLVLCLLLTWIIVYVSVIQGTKSLGKMSYFTASFPYIVLIALLIIACREEGAVDGIKHFFNPDIEKLKDPTVWYRACYGLAFIIYPEALSKIEYVPQLWSVLFFFMLFTLGIGSSMSQIETILTVIKDKFPKLRERKWLLSLCVCTMFFCLGLPRTTNVGQDILALLNNYGVGAAIFFYTTLQVVGVTWIYGIRNFCKDIEYMLGKAPNIFWKITWTFTAPIALMVLFIWERVLEAKKSKEETSDLPEWAISTGWILAAIALVQIPLWLMYVVYRDNHVTLWQKFLNSLKPSENWGPSDPVDRAGWLAMKKDPVQLSSHISNVYDNATFKDVF